MQNHVLTYANHFKHLYRQTFQPLSDQYGLSQLEIDVLLFLKNNPMHNTAKDISIMRGFAKSRSEERRVGKECSEPCRSRWSPYH